MKNNLLKTILKKTVDKIKTKIKNVKIKVRLKLNGLKNIKFLIPSLNNNLPNLI